MSPVALINDTLRRVPPWTLYVVGIGPVVWVFWAGATGRLGVEPIEAIEHRLGLWGLWLLIAGLCVTPLRRFVGVSLVKFRRAIGLLAFYYILLHLAVWLILDVQIMSEVWADIMKRPYITIGMLGFALMVPLALTSNNFAVRRMGAVAWQRLHRLTYGVAILGALHFVMLAKGFQFEPLIYMVIIIGLVTLRTLPKKQASAMRATG